MRVANRHELDLHAADDSSTYERGQVADENVVLVFTDAVVDLHHQSPNVWVFAVDDVFVKQPG